MACRCEKKTSVLVGLKISRFADIQLDMERKALQTPVTHAIVNWHREIYLQFLFAQEMIPVITATLAITTVVAGKTAVSITIAVWKLRTVLVYAFDKKSPQIVGLGPPMCWQIFGPGNFNANQLNILVHLPLL